MEVYIEVHVMNGKYLLECCSSNSSSSRESDDFTAISCHYSLRFCGLLFSFCFL